MTVVWKGREKEAVFYRGVVLQGPTEVSEEWFAEVKNPSVVEYKPRKKKTEDE